MNTYIPCFSPALDSHASGFTLIEMMVTIAVAAILLSIAAPSFQSMIERARVKSLAEIIYSNLQFAKGESLKGMQSTNENVLVTFKKDASPQCFGMIRGNVACDCSANPTDCEIGGSERKITFTNTEFPGAFIAGSGDETIQFDSIRGTATNGTIEVQSRSTNSLKLNVKISVIGRIIICVPSDGNSISGYQGC
ncbi:prepilin-type N-terminal cleavage/methylation domain-containing protein [Allochromatium palmeri]|uniref:Prepilin-type N-terminal cleavage/methylation domain-containing protein n=1 Tax=Allochromatium palmeri TaxID=231048 RepID=A0A6N8ELA4_9GAMM|nr:prepilin-type N-terminal cleavage/methylation domain-containing protein [Allochromatium palmeri]MTW23114.1 prepilin-type N-terminal cleavage/methylation domain-containing protein [Allochromatium palmeri]